MSQISNESNKSQDLKNKILQRSSDNKIKKIVKDNKNKEWSEWLEFDKVFSKPGKQGLAGLFKIKGTDYSIVFKVSQYINHLVQHEMAIMKGLSKITGYCPNFCKGLDTIKCNIDPKSRKAGNPFKPVCKYPIEKDVLLLEYIDNSKKLYNYINSDKIEEHILYSTSKQILMALSIAQKKTRFSHYDLHSMNIMMKKCDKDLVMLYVIDEENQFYVPTYGHYPVIIDYGFSYIGDLDNNPMWATLAHTDVGFTSDRFDWVADPKLFLVTVSDEINDKRKSKTSKKFRRIVQNIFNPLSIDWESGWDDIDDTGASDAVIEMLEDYNIGSELFKKYDHYCIDLLQSLIILPLQKQSYKNIDKAYKGFLEEFLKIENEINSPFYNLYILKEVVDVARSVRVDYERREEHYIKSAVNTFKQKVFNKIYTIAKFVQLKNVKFEKMLCSVLVLSKNIEGVLYDTMNAKMKPKLMEYNKLPVQNIDQIMGILQVNIPEPYVLTENTKVYVVDCVREVNEIKSIKSVDLEEINSSLDIAKGGMIYQSLFK